MADAREGPAERLVALLRSRSLRLALAESCTAGLVADAVARVPGASGVLWGSFVSYTLEAKTAMLGIERDFLEKHGAVSENCARAMALAASAKSGADLGLAVTGLAGPGGDGSGEKVGNVWIALSRGGKSEAALFHYDGSRDEIRHAAARDALGELVRYIETFPPN